MKRTFNPDAEHLKGLVTHKSGNAGGMLVGNRHSEGGIKAVNNSNNQPLELEGGEVVITRPAVADKSKRMFDGQMMTNREILSKINSNAGGVSFAEGGEVATSGREYYLNGKKMKDFDIVSSCGCKHKKAEGGRIADERRLLPFQPLQRPPHRKEFKQKREYSGIKTENFAYGGDVIDDDTEVILRPDGTWFKANAEDIKLTRVPQPSSYHEPTHYENQEMYGGGYEDGGSIPYVTRSWVKNVGAPYWYQYNGFIIRATPVSNIRNDKPVNQELIKVVRYEDQPNITLACEKLGKLFGLKSHEVREILIKGDSFTKKDKFDKGGTIVDVNNSGMNNKDKAKVTVAGYPWYITRIDSTHVYLSDNEDKNGQPYHVAQLKKGADGGMFYNSVDMWLDGQLNIDGKVFPSFDAAGKPEAEPELSVDDDFDWDALFAPLTEEQAYNIEMRLKAETDEEMALAKNARLKKIGSHIQGGPSAWNRAFLYRVNEAKRAIQDFVENRERKDLYEFAMEAIAGLRELGFQAVPYANRLEEALSKEAYNSGPKKQRFADGGKKGDARITPNGKLKMTDIPEEVRRFMPMMQIRAIIGSDEHWDTIERLRGIIDQMPLPYGTDSTPADDKIVWLHYFYGGSDWYIVEKDSEPEQYQAYGYAKINDDEEMAEWGYIDIEALKKTNKVELDFYWKPRPFGKISSDNDDAEAGDSGSLSADSDVYNTEKNSAGKFVPVEIQLDGMIAAGISSQTLKKEDSSASVYLWKAANDMFKTFIGKQSNLPYKIMFSDGFELEGVVDMEPDEHWDGKPQPFTWHLQTFYGNLARTPESKQHVPYDKAAVDFATTVIENYDLGEPVANLPAVAAPLVPTATPMQEVVIDNVPGGTYLRKDKDSIASFETNLNSKNGQYEANARISALVREKGADRDKYSAEEMALLKLYSGAGGLIKEGAKGAGILDQFYTPNEIIAKMWGLALKFGFVFKGSNILEPSVGVGRFLQYIPKDTLALPNKVVGYDVDYIAATICQLLFPDYKIRHASFETIFFQGKRNVGLAGLDEPYDLVIGNPPYRPYVSEYAPLGEKDATGAQTMEMYFLMRGVDVLRTGGLLVMIIPSTFMANDKAYNSFKENLNAKAELLDAYRLPSGSFDRTEVTTDILVFRKR